MERDHPEHVGEGEDEMEQSEVDNNKDMEQYEMDSRNLGGGNTGSDYDDMENSMEQ